ncbi:MAG: ABC transporter ATP-binding protein [Devosia nanyangense]|uniref:ABC transporter ATP-binding protein n=1 Tax=Devosia nanyangense TaxID=1228055 RepID=A0A933L3V3_9HYPH|nr:ABC transporter ATP-binding protein [Devosia nanyangense]
MFGWFERRLDPYPSAEPEQPPQGLVAFCLYYSRGAIRWLLLMAALSATISAGEVFVYGFLGRVIDWLGAGDASTFFAREGGTIAWMGAFVVGLFVLVSINSFIIHQTLLGNFPHRIRWMSHRYLLRQSMSYFQDEFAGRIAAKLMQTSLAVREVMMKLLDVVVFVSVYFIGAVILAATSDWRLAIPFVVWLALYSALLRHYVPRLGKVSELQADARSTMTGRVVDSYTNIATVKLFSHSSREEDYAKASMNDFLDTVYRQMRMFSLLNYGIYGLNSALLISVSGLGIWLWTQGQVTAGAVAVAVALVMRFGGMAQWVMWEMTQLFENIGTVRDGISSISLPSIVKDRPGAPALTGVKGDIRFDHVTFHYGKKDGGVIDGLDLHIRPGEKVGLVGRSGAGKSTIVNLLLRFYDREGGRILIDGTDIASVQQDTLRENIGVVTQDTSLLHRSVKENIAYGRPDATDAEIIAAAKLAEAHDFIEGLADLKGRKGYDAHVGERGVKLSGGQRQRVAIARVLLKNAPILVLDEATSALDSEVEAAIQSQLQTLMRGKTVIAIAHRLSTIAALDRLVVIEGGRIAEQGTHAELLALGGHYAKLWHRQSGGFIDADVVEEAAE